MLSGKSVKFDEEIKLVHGGIEGHWGVTATIKRLQEKGIKCKNMDQDVRYSSFVKSCSICQKLTDKSPKSHGSIFTVSVEEPNQRVAIDTMGPLEEDERGFKYILIDIYRLHVGLCRFETNKDSFSTRMCREIDRVFWL